jgi:hypothetical protein
MYGYSSGNGTINCPVGFMPALCIYLIQLLNTVKSVGHSERFVKYWSLAFAGCIALYFCYSPFAFIYRDAPTWSTAQLVNVGPFKGIYSTPDKVALLTFLQEDLTELAKTKKTIFASYMAPAYFITKMTPVTRMLNIHPVYWPPERVDEILEQSIKLKEFPEVVVTGKFGPQFTYQFENYFLATGKYSVAYQRPWYQILVKNKD